MSEVVPFDGLSSRESRQVSRELARLDARGHLELARTRQQAGLQAARVHSVAHVGQQALQATALLSELEGRLGRMVPEAEPRLRGIADITALGLAEIVSDTVRRVSQ